MLHLNQNKYIKELLDKCSLLDSKMCDTPMVCGKGVSKDGGVPLTNPSTFRGVVKGL